MFLGPVVFLRPNHLVQASSHGLLLQSDFHVKIFEIFIQRVNEMNAKVFMKAFRNNQFN